MLNRLNGLESDDLSFLTSDRQAASLPGGTHNESCLDLDLASVLSLVQLRGFPAKLNREFLVKDSHIGTTYTCMTYMHACMHGYIRTYVHTHTQSITNRRLAWPLCLFCPRSLAAVSPGWPFLPLPRELQNQCWTQSS